MKKSTRGGYRKGAGRKPNPFKRKNFTVRTDIPTHTRIKEAALKEGKSVSRFCLDATLENVEGANQ
jgi:uncharacterized protein (DUF1778 family)